MATDKRKRRGTWDARARGWGWDSGGPAAGGDGLDGCEGLRQDWADSVTVFWWAVAACLLMLVATPSIAFLLIMKEAAR
jgi:hypothetical protein